MGESAHIPMVNHLKALFVQNNKYKTNLIVISRKTAISTRWYCIIDTIASLRASSPIWASEVTLVRTRDRGFAARSRVLERLASLAQIGELARKLHYSLSKVLR